MTAKAKTQIHLTHGFPAFYDRDSEILILGSFPSAASRKAAFFYGHPRNRFWAVLAALKGTEVPETEEEKRAFLRRMHIALYDTIEACDITGSSDSSIRNAVPADLRPILDGSSVRRIFTNGKTSQKYYEKYQEAVLGIKAVTLPSTSPANAAWSLERLIGAWSVINEGDR